MSLETMLVQLATHLNLNEPAVRKFFDGFSARMFSHPNGERILRKLLTFEREVSPLLVQPESKMCDPEADFYWLGLMLANILKPQSWWAATYMAPFARMGLCGKVFFACRTTGRILFGVRNVPGKGFGMLDTTAGNWEYGEKAYETAEREAGDEIAHTISFSLEGQRPIIAEVMYSDYGGEKGRAYLDPCYIVWVDEEFIPPVTAEMSDWSWESESTILGTGKLVFEDVNAPSVRAGFAFIKRQTRLDALLKIAKERKLEPAEHEELTALCLER